MGKLIEKITQGKSPKSLKSMFKSKDQNKLVRLVCIYILVNVVLGTGSNGPGIGII